MYCEKWTCIHKNNENCLLDNKICDVYETYKSTGKLTCHCVKQYTKTFILSCKQSCKYYILCKKGVLNETT